MAALRLNPARHSSQVGCGFVVDVGWQTEQPVGLVHVCLQPWAIGQLQLALQVLRQDLLIAVGLQARALTPVLVAAAKSSKHNAAAQMYIIDEDSTCTQWGIGTAQHVVTSVLVTCTLAGDG